MSHGRRGETTVTRLRHRRVSIKRQTHVIKTSQARFSPGQHPALEFTTSNMATGLAGMQAVVRRIRETPAPLLSQGLCAQRIFSRSRNYFPHGREINGCDRSVSSYELAVTTENLLSAKAFTFYINAPDKA